MPYKISVVYTFCILIPLFYYWFLIIKTLIVRIETVLKKTRRSKKSEYSDIKNLIVYNIVSLIQYYILGAIVTAYMNNIFIITITCATSIYVFIHVIMYSLSNQP